MGNSNFSSVEQPQDVRKLDHQNPLLIHEMKNDLCEGMAKREINNEDEGKERKKKRQHPSSPD